jgi:uncharacterized protein (DUF1501 family)
MTKQHTSTRRQFFKQANCAAVGTASIASTLFTLKMMEGAAYGAPPAGYKALVCLFLAGGNDSYNMLVPRDEAAYGEYSAVRGGVGGGGLALDRATELLPITSAGQAYSDFGIHHQLPFLQKLYDGTYTPTDAGRPDAEPDLAFVANVGTLIEPTTLAQYNAESTQTPVGLFSHSDEQVHWQTLVPQVRGAGPKGWAGRVADLMTEANLGGSVGMNISLSGNNVLQVGPASIPYITDPKGAVLLKDYSGTPYTDAVDSILSRQYGNIYQKTLAVSGRSAIDTAVAFDAAVSPYDFSADFPSTKTGDRLRTVAEILAARAVLGMNRQIFFVQRGGWDHHNEVLLSQEELFAEINDAIEAFWDKLGSLQLQNEVVLFSASDFGRTLTSNGAGSDHAWGGNAFMLGGSVNGGAIYGQYPVLATGNDLDIGRGRLLPTTSVDEYCAELASWFGVEASEMSTIFPNAENFFNTSTTPYPLGILGA